MTVTLSPILKIGYPFPKLDFKAWAQLFSRCRFLREAEIESKRASLDLIASGVDGGIWEPESEFGGGVVMPGKL